MTLEEKEVFNTVVEKFRAQYPKRNISYAFKYGDEYLIIDGEVKMNLVGWNLLYCLTKLCEFLKYELEQKYIIA